MSSAAPLDPRLFTESKSGSVYGVAIVFAVLSTVVMSLRLYTRCGMLKTPGKDDWSMLVAQILAIVVSIITCLEAKHGVGRHVVAVGPEDSAQQVQLLYANILVYNLAMNIIKISFLLQYRRIFQNKVLRKICMAGIVYVALWAVVQDVVLGLACVPVMFIVPTMAKVCLDTLPIWYFSSAMSLITDFVIFLIPLPSVVGLHLPRKQKIMVSGIFCLGFFVCIISIIRIFTLRQAVNSTDPSWDNTEAAMWSVIELNVGILCSSLPTLRPLLARFVPGLSSSFETRDRSAYERYGGSKIGSVLAHKRSRRNSSTEDLAMGQLPGGIAGVTATCSAAAAGVPSNSSNEDLAERGMGHARVPSKNRIIVTRETSIREAKP